MACDGCCLTMTSVRAEAKGSAVHRRHLQRDARQDDDRRVAARARASISSARCRPAHELGGHLVMGHVDGLARIVDIVPDGESRRFSFEVPEHLAPYIAPKGSSGARRRLADGQRGERQPFRRQHHPPHLDGDHLGRENRRAIGQPRGRPVRALYRAAPGVPPVTHDVGTHRHLGRPRLPVLAPRDPRGHAQRPHGRARRRRGARERGRSRHSRADGDARRRQLHGQVRPRPRSA